MTQTDDSLMERSPQEDSTAINSKALLKPFDAPLFGLGVIKEVEPLEEFCADIISLKWKSSEDYLEAVKQISPTTEGHLNSVPSLCPLSYYRYKTLNWENNGGTTGTGNQEPIIKKISNDVVALINARNSTQKLQWNSMRSLDYSNALFFLKEEIPKLIDKLKEDIWGEEDLLKTLNQKKHELYKKIESKEVELSRHDSSIIVSSIFTAGFTFVGMSLLLNAPLSIWILCIGCVLFLFWFLKRFPKVSRYLFFSEALRAKEEKRGSLSIWDNEVEKIDLTIQKNKEKLSNLKGELEKIIACEDRPSSLLEFIDGGRLYASTHRKAYSGCLVEASKRYSDFKAFLSNNFHSTPDTCLVPHLLSDWSHSQWNNSKDKAFYRPVLRGDAPPILRLGQLLSLERLSLKNAQGYSNLHLPKCDEDEFIKDYIQDNEGDLSALKNFPFVVDSLASGTGNLADSKGHIVIFSNNAATREAATNAIESFAFRAFSTFPIQKLKGICIDPVSMGNTFPFKSLPEEIRGKRTFTTSGDIQEQLEKLVNHTEQVIQAYLSRDYSTLEEYNAVAGAIQEAYRYLFIADFPAKFENYSLEHLNSLLVNGAKAGVYAVIHVDETLAKPSRFNYKLLDEHCNVFRPTGKMHDGKPVFSHYKPLDNDFRKTLEAAYGTQETSNNGIHFEITLDQPPTNDAFNQIAELISEASGNIKADTIESDALSPAKLWTEDSRNEMRAPIGMSGARDLLEFWLGQNAKGNEVSQALLVGRPGAGKSYTLHSIINSLAMRYAPDELELYLLDYKEGVEFQIYVDPERGEDGNASETLSTERALPHAKVISIESDREFGLSVLQKVEEEFKRRSDKWKAVSNSITKVAEYRDRTEEKMPRILLIIDEFQVLFENDDNISAQANQILERISRTGRAYGVHLLLASQSPSTRNISDNLFNFIDLRMAMQMNQTIAAMTLAPGNTDVVELLDQPGKILYNSAQGAKDGNILGQVANFSPEARIAALRKIQATAQAQNYARAINEPLVLFDGRRPTRLQDNAFLSQLANADHWLEPLEIKTLICESNWRTREYPSVAWLGEAMRIGDHSRVIFRRQAGSNLLLIGERSESIYGILGGMLTSLACCHAPQQAEFFITDLSDEEDPGCHWSTLSLNFRETFSPHFSIKLAKDFPDKQRRIAKPTELLDEVTLELARRQQQRDEKPDDLNVGPSIFFVCAFGNLAYLNNLRPTLDDFGNMEMSEDAQKLFKLASEGAELGIHVVLWMENWQAFNQLCADGSERRSLLPFSMRVGLKMNAEDSYTLFNDSAASQLPEVGAYFQSSNTLEKFKPYAVPDLQTLERYGDFLSQKNP